MHISGSNRLRILWDKLPPGSQFTEIAKRLLASAKAIYESLFNPPKAILDEALPFQGELVHLLEEPLPKAIRGTIYCCVSLFVVALTVSILFKVDIVIQGNGKLTYDGPPIVLQPYEQSVLRNMYVRPGDEVRKGQVLASLDSTFSQADLTALEERKKVVHAQVRRLEAEAYGSEYKPDPADGIPGTLQAEVFQQRAVEYKLRLKALEGTIQESEAGLSRTQSERGIMEEQLAISSSIEGMQENLFKFKTNSKLEYLGAKSARLRAERDFKDAVDRLVEIQHHIQTVKAQRDGYIQEWRRTALEELTRQRSEELQIDAALTKSKRVNSLVEIKAPEDGVVLDIANRSVGSVLRGAEPLIVLAPIAVPLVVEMELNSSEVGDVAIGDRVLVKVDAFPFQRYGGLEGKIRSVSHESHMGGSAGDIESVGNKKNIMGGSHRVSVELLMTRMEHLPKGRNLFPGMTVAGEVHVGKRRLINYLLYPLLRGLRESFRET